VPHTRIVKAPDMAEENVDTNFHSSNLSTTPRAVAPMCVRGIIDWQHACVILPAYFGIYIVTR
jgi:hypothetical protein